MNITPAIATPVASEIKTKPAVSANNAAPAEENKVSTPAESFTPAAEGESRLSAAWRGGVRKGVDWGNKLEKPLGGAAAIGLAAAGGLAMAFGGAVVGGIVGGGFAPAISSLVNDGAWNFIKGSFSNLGSAISWGSTLGSVVGLVGGIGLGIKAGGGVAKTVAFVPGFVAGGVAGLVKPGSVPAPEHKEKVTKQRTELRGVFKAEGRLLSGMGALSGAVGGFVGGAALTAAGSLVADVAKGNFTFSTFMNHVGGQALVGGLIGGGLLAAVGGQGGESIAQATQWTYDKTIGRATAGQPGIKERLDKKQNELNARKAELDSKAEAIGKDTETYRASHKQTSDALTGREDQLANSESTLKQNLAEIDGRIEKNAQSDFSNRSAQPDSTLDAKGDHAIIGNRGSLNQWDAKLNKWQGELNGFRGELQSWEQKLDTKIDRDAAAIFAEERKPVDSHFATLKGELDAFESKLNNYENDIKRRIDERYRSGINAEKPGVDRELNDSRNDKSASERDKSDARSQRDVASSRHNSAQSSLNSAKNRLHSAQSEEQQLRSRISSLQSRISSLESQLSSCRNS